MEVEVKSIIEARTLLDAANDNYGVLQRQLKDLTHEESLLQLPFRGNCLNWIVGHITQSRNKMLMVVDEQPLWTQERIARYDRGSEPITSGEDAVHFDHILTDLKAIHETLTAKLERMTIDDLSVEAKRVINGIPPWTVGEFMRFLLWHETYHVGQTEILRQLAGKNDRIIG